jgi:hypothetical protein
MNTTITSGPQYAGPWGGGGLFPPSVEQRLGVNPNECFVDVPGGRQQVPCTLDRHVRYYFDAPGGRAVVFDN